MTNSTASSAPAAQQGNQTYELRGKVVNAVTGEGIANALVRLRGNGPGVQFSAADGGFAFPNLPAGNYVLHAAKPGYFNDQELGVFGPSAEHALPADTDAVEKLTPEGVIYGRVENENGQPIEGLTVQAENWQVMNGHKQRAAAASGMTDDEGQFRIAQLRPGNYYLHFIPRQSALAVRRSGGGRGMAVTRREMPATREQLGFGSQFYPGVADAGSAMTVHISSGSQVRIAQTLKPQKLFSVAGMVHGLTSGRWFHVLLQSEDGQTAPANAHSDPKSGEFQFDAVAEGKYVLMVMAQEVNEDQSRMNPRPLSTMMPLQVNRDIAGLAVMLGRGATINVAVEDEIPAREGETHQVQVSLSSLDLPQLSQGLMLPAPPGAQGMSTRFDGVAPGSYEVEAGPVGPGYVASLRSGDVDLLRDELVVAQGASMPPIEVRLKNDGAELHVEVTDGGKPAVAGVVIYSEEYPKKSIEGVAGPDASFAAQNLRPGLYKVVVLRGTAEVQFRDAAFMEKYLPAAKEVELKPGDSVNVKVEVQAREDE